MKGVGEAARLPHGCSASSPVPAGPLALSCSSRRALAGAVFRARLPLLSLAPAQRVCLYITPPSCASACASAHRPRSPSFSPVGSRPLAVLALAATAAAAGSLWLCYRAVQRADAATGAHRSALRVCRGEEAKRGSEEGKRRGPPVRGSVSPNPDRRPPSSSPHTLPSSPLSPPFFPLGELESARRELTSAEERVASLERLVSERESSIKELSGKVEALKTSLEGAVGEARSSRSRMFMMERELKQTNGLVRRLQEADQSGYDEDRHEW